jgi:hypothetical protein
VSKRDATAFEVSPLEPESFKRGGLPGAYTFVHRDGKKVGIVHGCPCGCGIRSVCWFEGSGSGRAEWKVTGEWPKVTLAPSIGIHGPNGEKYHWHGYLTDGVFREC